jgi:hypothetical protein
MTYAKVNVYVLNLEVLRRSLDLEQVFSPLSVGMRKSQEFAQKVAKEASSDPDYVDAVWDQESYIEESLLGGAFVVCQASIKLVVSEIGKLHARYKRDSNKDLTTTDGTKRNIMRLGSRVVRRTGYSQIEIMNAFANYFKHRAEWSSWTRATGLAKPTIAIVAAVGGKEGMSRNLLQGAKALGNRSGDDLHVFAKILDNWRSEAIRKYESELKSKNLIS